MTDFGNARPASHADLSARFGGLLPRVETPDTTSDQTTVEAPPAADEASTNETVAPKSTSQASGKPTSSQRPKPKRATKRKAAGEGQSAPTPKAVPAEEPSRPEDAIAEPQDAVEGKADQPVQISLPSSIEARLAKFKAETGLSHPNILFNAIEATADQLPVLVKAKTVQLGATSGVSLFNRPQTAIKREVVNEPKKTFIIRITKQNKRIIDDLVQQVEAPNRNVLIVTAYDNYLPTD